MPSDDDPNARPDDPSVSDGPTRGLDSEVARRPGGAMLAPGEVLCERFRVLRLVGRGGMGEVYEADDLELNDRIALKTILPELVHDAAARERFRHEIHLARKVTHPNVCRTFDLERHHTADRDVTFLTMELLPGLPLSEHLRRSGPMAAGEARLLARQVAEGLAAAHRAGVLHRDLKPANVVLVPTSDGFRPVITDFGLACMRGADPGRAGAGSVVGTRGYVAPEVLAGRPATAASDVYCLGLVFRAMSVGAAPRDGGPGRAPPPDLQELIDHCLDPDPARRPATAGDVVRAMDHRATRARPARGRVWAAVAITLVAVVLVAGWAFRRAQGTASRPLEPVQVTTSPSLELFPALSPAGDAIAYASDQGGRFQIYRKDLAPGGREEALTHEGDSFQPAWSPDGRSIAFHRRDDGLWTMPAQGGTARQVARFGSHPAWSPDGARIAFQSQPLVDLAPNSFPALPPSTLWIVDRDGGEPRPLTTAGRPAGGHGAPAWSPDGARVVFSAADRRSAEIWSVGADGGDLVRLVNERPYAFDPVYAPDGRRVYFSAWSGRLTYGIWSVPVSPQSGHAEGLPVEAANVGGLRVRHLAISRDGRRIAYAGLTLSSNLWQVPLTPQGAPAGTEQPLTADTGKTARPAFSPDGRTLAFDRGRPGNPTDLWLMDLATARASPLTTHRAEESLASWFPAGDRIAFVSDRTGRFAFWSIGVRDRAERLLLDLDGGVDWPRLSPDGREVAFNAPGEGGVLNTWIATLGGAARQITFDREMMGFPCWSPDGSRLALEVKRGDDTQVVVVARDGSRLRQVTTRRGQAWPYSWSPDGSQVAFAGHRDGLWNVWSVSVATGAERQLTSHTRLSAYVRTPAWSPRGDQVVYEHAETTGDIWMIEPH